MTKEMKSRLTISVMMILVGLTFVLQDDLLVNIMPIRIGQLLLGVVTILSLINWYFIYELHKEKKSVIIYSIVNALFTFVYPLTILLTETFGF